MLRRPSLHPIASKKPEKAIIKRMLLLLLAADLLRLRSITVVVSDDSTDGSVSTETNLIAWVPFLPNASPVLVDDNRWAKLPLKVVP